MLGITRGTKLMSFITYFINSLKAFYNCKTRIHDKLKIHKIAINANPEITTYFNYSSTVKVLCNHITPKHVLN